MFARLTPVVKNIIIINVLLWLATFVMAQQGVDLARILGGHYPGSPLFGPWQVVTHMFMHATVSATGGLYLWHILFNMYGLYLFGTSLEQYWGSKRFLIYYMITGLGAFFLHELIIGIQVYQYTGSFFPSEQQLIEAGSQAVDLYIHGVVGASGAVYGVLLGFGMLFPNTRLMLLFPPIPIKAKWLVVIFGVIELYTGLNAQQGDNVAHFAHLGGMLFGYLLLKYWQKSRDSFY